MGGALMLSPAGEKPFACNWAFNDCSNLHTHLQANVDIKRYWCCACARTFFHVSLLAQHDKGRCCGAA